MLSDIWKAVGVLPDNVVENEHLVILFSYITNNLALYDRCRCVWSSFMPSSTFYQHLPDIHDWAMYEDGTFIPKGAPMGRQQCTDMFERLLEKLDLDKARRTIFDENSFKAMIEILKLGKTSFPGLVVRQPELDLVMKGMLKACFVETVWRFMQGKGKSSMMEDIWRELRSFETISVAKDRRLLARPTVSVYVTTNEGQTVELVDLINDANGGAPVRSVNAAVMFRCQSRILVRLTKNLIFFVEKD